MLRREPKNIWALEGVAKFINIMCEIIWIVRIADSNY